jgi:hypothetical protein
MIDSAKYTIVYTDYAVNVSIATQTTLKTTNIDKLNLRFIRVSQYLSQFLIEVK